MRLEFFFWKKALKSAAFLCNSLIYSAPNYNLLPLSLTPTRALKEIMTESKQPAMVREQIIKKCSKCGANYFSQHEKCPFCGEPQR